MSLKFELDGDTEANPPVKFSLHLVDAGDIEVRVTKGRLSAELLWIMSDEGRLLRNRSNDTELSEMGFTVSERGGISNE